ncbi:MAG: hypothetical protein WD491_00545 [Balneolales bacterium]
MSSTIYIPTTVFDPFDIWSEVELNKNKTSEVFKLAFNKKKVVIQSDLTVEEILKRPSEEKNIALEAKIILKHYQNGSVKPREITDSEPKFNGIKKPRYQKLMPLISNEVDFGLLEEDRTDLFEKILEWADKGIVKANLLHKGSLDYLFEIRELSNMKESKKGWFEYISPYNKLPTNRLYLMDRYLFANDNFPDLEYLLSPFKHRGKYPKHIHIVSAQPKKINQFNVWLNKQRKLFPECEIICKAPKRNNNSDYHDRFLFTDHWLLKIETGFGFLKKQKFELTFPTLAGRYAPQEIKWSEINKNWLTQIFANSTNYSK